MKKLLALAFIAVFAFAGAQVSGFEKADSKYERKKKALYNKYPKPNDLRTKLEWLLTEDKITSYKNALEKIAEDEKKALVNDPPSKTKLTKEAEYETGKTTFLKSLYEAVDLVFLNYASDSYKATLSFVVDSKGNALAAEAKGNNDDVNAFIEAAFYRIKDKGKWKPAEINGKPVSSMITIPLVLKFKK